MHGFRACATNIDINQRPYLTTREVADRFQVSRVTVNRWVKDGKLPAFSTPGGTLRFRREDIDAFFPTDNEPIEAAS